MTAPETVSKHSVRGGHVTSPDGTRISYLAFGTGPRIVFVHGGLGNGLYWRAGGLGPAENGVSVRLEDRFETILVDRRGHGASDWGHGPHSIDREADDLLAILDQVGPVAAVVGHSYGATVAMEAALRWAPDAVENLVLYEPAMAITGPVLDTDGLGGLTSAVAAGAYDRALAHFLAGMGTPEMDRLKNTPVWPVLCAIAPTLVPTVAAVDRVTSAQRYAAISCPVLLLGGDSSPLTVAAHLDALATVLPTTQRVVFEGHGHYATSTAPDLFAATIADFVSSAS